jgi:hypothetical protein
VSGRARAAVAGALVLAGLLAAPVLACNEATHAPAAHRGPRHGGAPLVLGDSTLIIAAPVLGRMGIEADAHGCRQFAQGTAIAAARAGRRLPDAVVFALGANGPVARSQIGRARRVLGRHRFLVLVTPRNLAASARTMRAADRAHPDRVLTLDWARFSAGHGSWFAGDDLHVNFTGARHYARFIRDGLAPFFGPPHRGRPLDLPLRRDAKGVTRCGATSSYGRTIDVSITRGAEDLSCRYARKLMRAPRLHPPPRWRFYDWRRVGRGPWTDVLARRDRSIVLAGIAR